MERNSDNRRSADPQAEIRAGRETGIPPDRRGARMIVAGGGTGGHLFPGIAIAEEFLRRDPRNRVLFIGTERGLEKKILGPLGFPLRILKVEGLKGRGAGGVVASLLKVPGSMVASFEIIREFAPDVVIGVGGYASGPAVLMARLMGKKTAIAEQNAFPGLTNRILGRFAHRVFLSFSASQKWFRAGRTRVAGNPIRSAFLEEKAAGERNGRRFTVLVFGGSQGAHAINRIVGEALDDLLPLKDRLRFIHQTGEEDREAVAGAYRKRGFEAKVSPFITDMAAAYREADLLVCRAGATSIAEITAAGKAAILIPFPFAAGDHQTRNAEVLAAAGAAEMMPEGSLNGPRLAEAIERICRDPGAVRKMEAAAAALGNRRAAADIVDACLEMVREREISAEC
ncbi:MAG: undecaprenyldiphospho-muramoylpentapeptide beta-N-acetylglucosaminyltransferase [Proteobacteria bacterium]|nr:undecaprenyldiphospho-muramoylpentapeptide beta-N-acetylglucosaminyltransferase [Pseudomonadota bacterium]MBU2228282.1 undecaprenyldiphospho-muramoylpentapeptide beta-N-acetylglucosaminyltransferase [Pseudomonadota bacterium]MBU2262913.1 undecaprenyldiphospho-muramoylpentapeptide beta-N-acetylglucosaminyltransferase [Pseudomonadota bacterium]